MQIAQAPLTFFHVRLKEIDRLTELLIFPMPLDQLLIQIFVDRHRGDLTKIGRMEFLEELRIPGQKPGFHHRRPHRRIAEPKTDAIRNRAYTVTHLKADVPEGMQHLPDKLRHNLRHIRTEQHHQIDI